MEDRDSAKERGIGLNVLYGGHLDSKAIFDEQR